MLVPKKIVLRTEMNIKLTRTKDHRNYLNYLKLSLRVSLLSIVFRNVPLNIYVLCFAASVSVKVLCFAHVSYTIPVQNSF